MSSREFCYWLMGFFEINDAGLPGAMKVDSGLIGERVDMIKRHLALVFKHEIDPSYPNQDELNKIHEAADAMAHAKPNYSDTIIRC